MPFGMEISTLFDHLSLRILSFRPKIKAIRIDMTFPCYLMPTLWEWLRFSVKMTKGVFSQKEKNIKESNLTINWFHIAAKQTTKTAILFEGIEKS